jgi:pentose-5-phosphate-3-epimerase
MMPSNETGWAALIVTHVVAGVSFVFLEAVSSSSLSSLSELSELVASVTEVEVEVDGGVETTDVDVRDLRRAARASFCLGARLW